MTDDRRHEETPRTPGATVAASPPRNTRSTPWPAVLAALVVGLLLGSLLTWAATRSDVGEHTAAPAATATPTPTTTPVPAATTAGAVVVPESCLKIADEAGLLNTAIGRGAAAVRDLDAASLSGIVRDVGARQERISALAEECRAAATAPRVVATTG